MAAAAAPAVMEAAQPQFELGIHGNGGASSLAVYDYGQGHGWAELDNGDRETVPAMLVRKVCLVEAEPPGAAPEAATRLPVYTLSFANPEGVDRAGKAFESLGVRIELGDTMKMVIPEFRAKSYSVSAERPGEFDITLKVYPHGRASGYLNSMELGQSIGVWRRSQDRTRRPGQLVALVAYGVAITEILPLAAAELAKPEAAEIRVLWASRTEGDTFWTDQLQALKLQHGKRFSFVEIISRDPGYAERTGALQGRITAAVLRAVFDEHWGTGLGGPNEAGRAGVRFLNVAEKQLIKEANQIWEGELGYPTAAHKLLL